LANFVYNIDATRTIGKQQTFGARGGWICLWSQKAKLSAVTHMFTGTSIYEYCHVIMFLQ